MNFTFKIRPFILAAMGIMLFFSTGVQAQTEKIYGGEPIQISEVPWQVSMEFITPQNPIPRHGCGGSIIHPEWVLTAAHCASVFVLTPERLTIHAGSTLQEDNSVGQRVAVDQVILHPGYGGEGINFDLALLHLAEPLCFDENVQAIAVADQKTELSLGMIVNISGWGDSGSGCCTNQLMGAALPIISDNDANTLLFGQDNTCPLTYTSVSASSFAVFEFGISTGSGDSGGPATIEVDGVPTLIGATSWGGCPKAQFPSVYADVGALSDFVFEHVTPTFENCDAEFTVSMEEDQKGNLFFTFDNSDQTSFEHSWTVLGHAVSGTGPYTVVAQGNASDFDFQGTLGGCYTILHQVTSPCETCCYSREVCNENATGEWLSKKSDHDCEQYCNLIPPTGLACAVDTEGFLNLIWDEVPGALSYTVTMLFNDPECCGAGSIPFGPYDDGTTENFLRLDFYPNCMSWTVTAHCADGSSGISEEACYDAKQACEDRDICHLIPPTGLVCTEDAEGFLNLNWNAVPGALSYTVTMVFDDPECCGPGSIGIGPYDVGSTENFVRLDFSPNCMSWVVTAHCEEDGSSISETACYDAKQACEGRRKSLRSYPNPERGVNRGTASSLSVFPNPSSGIINYSLQLDKYDEIEKISIIDLSGKLIERIDYQQTKADELIGTYRIQKNLSGLYYIQVQLQSDVLTERILILK